MTPHTWPRFLAGGGSLGAMFRGFPWSQTPLGPPTNWPQPLRTLVGVMLAAEQPMFLAWGPERTLLYNDAYAPLLGRKHPHALGRPFFDVWSEIREDVIPLFDRVFAGAPVHMDDISLVLDRRGRPEEAHFAFSYTPVSDEHGEVVGLFCPCTETTEKVFGERRVAFLLELEQRLRLLSEPADILTAAAAALGRQLAANQAGYSDIDDAVQYGVIEHEWNDGTIPSNVGMHRIDDFGPGFAADLRAGRRIVIEDVAADPRTATPAALATFERVSIRAFLNLPVLKGDRLVALFVVHSRLPRPWSVEDVSLAAEVTERTWATVARARAEARLRLANDELERALVAQRAERNRLWDNSQDLLAVVDSGGVFRAVSPVVTAILGWTPEDMVGRPVFDFVVPEDAVSTAGALEHARVSSLPHYENRYRHKEGGNRWFSWVAAPEGELIFAIGRHITAEKEAARALERSQARLRSMFETSFMLQALLTPTGVLLDANPSALAAIGAARDQVTGLSFWEAPWFAATPGMGEIVRAAVEAAAGGGGFRQELSIELPAGVRTYDFSIRPIYDSDGAVIAIVPEAVDVTDRRHAEDALRQAQKMEAVGQLTGGLAHDFNNLLTGIAGSLELLQSRAAQGRFGELERYVNAAQGAARRAAALTHRLLAFSRRQTLDPRPSIVNQLVAGMEDLVRRTMGPAITVEVVVAGGLWATSVDQNQLENALLNLCINARDAMPDGGRLTIETANRWLDERAARERDLPAGQYVSLCVSDTGTGMSPEVARRAFDPFFTTKPIGMGTGLGLSMIYGFARQSGGQARIYSEPGQGTMVCLYLPRYLGALESADVETTAGEVSRAQVGETVLVVDDEPTVRMLVAEVLLELGYVAIEAKDGAAGLQVLQSNARIDLLITDVGLPGGINGRQVADAGRAVRPNLKVLFITGYAENAVVGNGHLEPGMHVLTKPFAVETLSRRIRDLIADA